MGEFLSKIAKIVRGISLQCNLCCYSSIVVKFNTLQYSIQRIFNVRTHNTTIPVYPKMSSKHFNILDLRRFLIGISVILNLWKSNVSSTFNSYNKLLQLKVNLKSNPTNGTQHNSIKTRYPKSILTIQLNLT